MAEPSQKSKSNIIDHQCNLHQSLGKTEEISVERVVTLKIRVSCMGGRSLEAMAERNCSDKVAQ